LILQEIAATTGHARLTGINRPVIGRSWHRAVDGPRLPARSSSLLRRRRFQPGDFEVPFRGGHDFLRRWLHRAIGEDAESDAAVRGDRNFHPRRIQAAIAGGLQGTDCVIAFEGYLESILDWATAKEYRKGDNPASLDGPLGIRLPQVEYAPKHYAALPYQQIGEFMAQLRALARAAGEKRALSSYVIEFIILTAVRSHQALGMQWDEIDWNKRIWTCPEERTKGGRGITHGVHEVPLSKPALAILEAMRDRQKASGMPGLYVFTHGAAITHGSIFRGKKTKYIASPLKYGGKRMHRGDTIREYLWEYLKRPELTIHGFRTTFKTWSVEHGYSEVLSEMALHHRVGNQVRNIYARPVKLIEPRRQMMEAWAEYCDRTQPLSGEVVPLRKAK
jgi:integrase